MSVYPISSVRRLMLFAVGAAGLAAAPLAASAQDSYDSRYESPPAYGPAPYDYDGPYRASDDADNDRSTRLGDVIVRAPRHEERDPSTGAPIEWVSTSRLVRYDDLDLRSGWGAHELRERISRAAYEACDDLDARFITLSSGDDRCVRAAVHRAIEQTPLGDGE